MDHIMSDFLSCEVGVPQGSNLGPLLFLIYFNDLPHTLSCDVEAYADDTTMTVSGAIPEEIGRKLTENCEVVSTWMMGNRLKLNADKTVGTSRRL
jgi:ribonuclease P/MRP protein subunit RPP40